MMRTASWFCVELFVMSILERREKSKIRTEKPRNWGVILLTNAEQKNLGLTCLDKLSDLKANRLT
jgi:hypothetical protein